MARGFKNSSEFKAMLSWELYQVTLDKYHVMFHFNNGWAILNVAYKFAIRSPINDHRYEYEIYGASKLAYIDPILREPITRISVISIEQLDIEFKNGYVLEVFDDPDTCSWWAWGGKTETDWKLQKNHIQDQEPDLLSEKECEDRLCCWRKWQTKL